MQALKLGCSHYNDNDQAKLKEESQTTSKLRLQSSWLHTGMVRDNAPSRSRETRKQGFRSVGIDFFLLNCILQCGDTR